MHISTCADALAVQSRVFVAAFLRLGGEWCVAIVIVMIACTQAAIAIYTGWFSGLLGLVRNLE